MLSPTYLQHYFCCSLPLSYLPIHFIDQDLMIHDDMLHELFDDIDVHKKGIGYILVPGKEAEGEGGPGKARIRHCTVRTG